MAFEAYERVKPTYLVSNIKYSYFSSYRLAQCTVSLRKPPVFSKTNFFFKYLTTINKSGVTE
jgi:hypothetical protein